MNKSKPDSDLDGSDTFTALRAAFLEEATLAYRYLYFATVAEFEGRAKLAELFRELAESGFVNVHGCLDYLKTVRDPDSQIPIGESYRNLQSLLQTEVQHFNQLYPERAKAARQEGFVDVASWFETLEKLKRSRALKLRQLESELEGKER